MRKCGIYMQWNTMQPLKRKKPMKEGDFALNDSICYMNYISKLWLPCQKKEEL